jgi:hypothetical protein
MMRLEQQQAALRLAIILGDAAGRPGGAVAPGLLRPRQDGSLMLRIYQHAYSARLSDALRDNYGVLPQIMGDQAFDALAMAYIGRHPSAYPSIRWFGDRLPEFMAQREDLVAHPAFVDLARMEWTLRLAFDAADALVLPAQALTAVAGDDWPRLVFVPHPTVQLLSMQWSVEPAWRVFKTFDPATGEEPELPAPQQAAHTLLVWRQGLETRWRALDGLAAELLRQVLAGSNFSALCDAAHRQLGESEAAPAVVAALQGWLADGLLTDFRLGSATA